MGNTGNGAATAAPVFKLREISADAVFLMMRLLSKLGIGELGKVIGGDLAKASSFKVPTTMKDGKEVLLPVSEWTEKQKAAAQQAQAAQNQMMMQLIDTVLTNFADCKADLYALLADGYGCSVEDIAGVSGIELIDLIDGYVNRDGFSDFFMRAMNLVSKTFSSGSLTRSTKGMEREQKQS